jgi:hypothetical protein
VRTTGGVEAFVGNEEALDGPSVDDVRLDDLVDIVGGDAAVPDRVRINDDGGAVFALVETSGHVGAHALSESAESQFLFEEELQLGLACRITAAARVPGIALIAANEQVLLKLGHSINLQDSEAELRRTG